MTFNLPLTVEVVYGSQAVSGIGRKEHFQRWQNIFTLCSKLSITQTWSCLLQVDSSSLLLNVYLYFIWARLLVFVIFLCGLAFIVGSMANNYN